MPLKADLDAIDWKILRELQKDGRVHAATPMAGDYFPTWAGRSGQNG